ncbi:Sterol regulatory element-binding protein cleavage-activating protein [Lasiodiplodia hormozganensis]|uniref:Sterol regulatory element-binding protein cleavage-activating protein n=1 Tax=Lasiodiplodia hormozganensis TaxID=869390 RepID=A0AA39XQR3_9PEZI|nr:Sterol regulatory element-binding protein cleavage-activating protein [Lasiodiplodia hormozganensis]
MIWYLLYAFRGTTEPPKLSSEHPIRRAFASYGNATARHWLFSLLLSVAVAVFLCYPVVFLYESPAAGGLPHHVWTSVRTYDGPLDATPDVEMRQLWVHGSYMKALDARVLRDALEIQDTLIGPGFGHELGGGVNITGDDDATADGPSEGSQELAGCCSDHVSEVTAWSCHSPLMYWNCSLPVLEDDADVLRTVNSQRGRRSSYNFTLQPLSVFAGKSFNGTRLLAADALVITIFDRSGGTIAEEFDRRSRRLALDASERWNFYPVSGSTYRNRLYEFRYQPMSMNDAWTLVLAYSLMLFYVLFSLRKLKAVKSVFGLFCTVIAQMFISICSSFTICGILRINLANVPGEAYPFVVLVIGLENMFRLINAVLESPAHMPTVTRVANALADVGHLALAAAAQNLLILWLLSRMVSPSVAPACAFAAVALVFDFVFHLTFFVAVLSVDVRRMELQDSLDRINLATQRRSSTSTKVERRTWGGALLQGKLPFSTRIAGTVAMISFILALNWHFFDHDRRPFSFVNILRLFRLRNQFVDPVPPPPINQARTPEAWLKMQDYISAKELIDFVKPGSHSFIARVYEPLTVVMKDADRRGAANQVPSVLIALRDLAEQHFFPFALAIVFAIAAVTLLMNYLLWNELPEEDAESGIGDDEPLSVRSLPKSHELDVVKVATCSQGHFVAISLDRLTSIWFLDHRTHAYSHVILQTSALQPPLWPIVATAIDDTGHWVAILTDSGRVALWSLAERRFVKSRVLDIRSQSPSVFAFAFHQMDEVERLSLLVVFPDGRLNEVDFRTGHLWTHQISEVALANAALSCCIKGQPKIVSVSKDGAVHLSFPSSGEWSSETLDAVEDWKHPDPTHSKIKYTYPIPSLCMLAAVRSSQVDLIDIPTRTLVHTFQTGQIKGHTLRVLHSKKQICGCHSPTVPDFSIVYTDSETQECIMHTYAPGEESANGLICLRPPALGEDEHVTCSGFERATEALHSVKTPGSWEATCIPSVVGIRKRPASDTPPARSTSSDVSYFPLTAASSNPFQNGTLKHRDGSSLTGRQQPNGGSSVANGYHRVAAAVSPGSTGSETEEWEAWTLAANGELHTTPLLPRPRRDSMSDVYMEEDFEEEQLFVSKPGPIVRIGKKSVAVGFGNALKIISLGSERFEEETTNAVVDSATLGLTWRKKAQGKKAGEREKERERIERMEREKASSGGGLRWEGQA